MGLSQPQQSVTALVQQILLSGLVDEEEVFSESCMTLVWGIHRLRSGLLRSGLRKLSQVPWNSRYMAVSRRFLELDILLNAVAEDVLGSFGKALCEGPFGMVIGALLGERVFEIRSYYKEKTCFVTRVVGLNYENRSQKIEQLRAGEPAVLIWDPLSTPDPNAVRVFSPKVGDLGFIRRTIAPVIAERIRQGLTLSAYIIAIDEPDQDPNERVYIRVCAGNGVYCRVPNVSF